MKVYIVVESYYDYDDISVQNMGVYSSKDLAEYAALKFLTETRALDQRRYFRKLTNFEYSIEEWDVT